MFVSEITRHMTIPDVKYIFGTEMTSMTIPVVKYGWVQKLPAARIF